MMPAQYKPSLAVLSAALLVLLAFLFWKSFDRDYVLFSNDAPLGLISSDASQQASSVRGLFTGLWNDLNWLGLKQPSVLPHLSFGIYLLLGSPVATAKFYAPVALLLLGLSSWLFFRTLRFHPLVCLLGGLAAALHTNTLSNAAWGLPGRALNLALIFLALSAVYRGVQQQDWTRYPLFALGGMAVGLGIMEGFDVGALFSLYVAGFTLFLVWQQRGAPGQKLGRVGMAIGTVALCAGLMAAQGLFTLLDTQVRGIQGAEQDLRTKAQRWDWATQWSLPKVETLRVAVPGLFGYGMMTPDGGNYWGTVGRQPGWEEHQQGLPRHSGSGEYAGMLVVLVALLAVAQSFRRRPPALDPFERRLVWFWAGTGLLMLLLAWGRHAPLYQVVYLLPYFSTIRNPIKFMHLFQLAVLVLFAIGLQTLLEQRQTGSSAAATLGDRIKRWWGSAGPAEKRIVQGLGLTLGGAAMAWLIYAASHSNLRGYLVTQGFPSDLAEQMARFSVREAGWALLFLLGGAGVVGLLLTGALRGRNALWPALLLGSLLVLDLGRASRPWIIHYNHKEKYETNPVIEVLRQSPAQQRVVAPFYLTNPQPGGPRSALELMYHEWLQAHFQYYNIQSLDVIQLPRKPEEYVTLETRFASPRLQARLWELTNTRLIFGLAQYFEALNIQFDPEGKRFRLRTRFTFATGPEGGIETVATPEGPFALFEFDGALPRMLFLSEWEAFEQDGLVLERLLDPSFDLFEQVLISGASPPLPAPSLPTQAGAAPSIELVSYSPKEIQLRVQTDQPGILLYNDRFDPDWRVRVNGSEETLLRCNYVMRGVALPSGDHTVEFRFTPPSAGVYVSLATWLAGLMLGGLLLTRRSPATKLPEAGKPERAQEGPPLAGRKK